MREPRAPLSSSLLRGGGFSLVGSGTPSSPPPAPPTLPEEIAVGSVSNLVPAGVWFSVEAA